MAALDGRVAIVTGASSGLGARFAELLASLGAEVVAAARRLGRLEELAAGNPRIHPRRCDVADEAERRALVEGTLDSFARVDVCVNNAGTGAGLDDDVASVDVFRRVLGVNLESAFALSQLVAAPMREQASGSIVNVSSMFGLVATQPLPDPAYAASKGAVNSLTRDLAAHWAKDGIRVNAIAPGWFETEMTAGVFADERTHRWLQRSCPMGRAGQPSELDGVLTFLATDASSYCTGQVIVVDGGWTLR